VTDDEAAFVEAVGQFLGSSGMTPMSGRMWAWLLVCEPPEQSATDLALELKASRGSISGTARLLTTAGLIRRTTRRGDRREYFSAPPGAFNALIETAGAGYGRFSNLTEQGLSLMHDRSPASRARLQEVHDAFSFLASEFPTILERFHQERARASAGHTTGASTRKGSR
jgi:DNA-binding transcriptional regulator GbsR (MarR family)